jgi:hypothetical protein
MTTSKPAPHPIIPFIRKHKDKGSGQELQFLLKKELLKLINIQFKLEKV